MQLSRYPPNDPRLRRSNPCGAKFVAPSPEIFGRCGIRDADIDAQHAGVAALGASGDHISDFLLGPACRFDRVLRPARHQLQ